MNPNPEIYGAPETWHDCYYGGGSTQPWTIPIHAEKAKVPTWGLANPDDTPTFVNTQLRTAVDDNKLSPREPIDNSICAVGQGRMSPFRKFAVYANHVTTQAPNGEILQIGHAYTGASYNDNETTINTFWYEANCSSSWGIYGNGAFSNGRLVIRDGATITQGLDQRIWSPTGANSHGTKKQNGNFYIAPFMSYGTRTYVLQIWVYVTTADYDSEYSGNIPSGGWKTLDDWKTNFSTKAITGCLLRVRAASQYDASTGNISYYGVNYNSSDYRKVSCGILDTMKFELDDGTTLPDLCSYGLFTNSSNTDVGVALFNDLSNVYKWSDTLQQIAIIPEYISQYIKTNGTSMFPYIPYSEDIYDWIMESCACFGMAFTPAKIKGTDSSNCRFNQNFTDPDLCLPIIDDNGIAHGDYTRGADNVNNDFINLSSQWDKNYQPSKPVDKNTYSNVTGFNTITSNAALTKFYVLDSANVEKLGDDLWTICDGLSAGDFEHFEGKIKDEFLTTNPIDSIIALKRFPFNIPHTFNPNKVPVQLGKETGSAQGYRTFEIIFGVSFKGIDIFPRFGDCFLDYSPYTKYELYIPFCGTVEINAGDILGHTLNCDLLVDLLTGSCICYIMADQLVIGTAKGSCGVDMQMSGAQTATMNANIFNGILNAQLAETQHITSIGKISLNPFKWYENIEVAETRQLQTQHDITHMVVPLHKMGSASPLLSWVQEFNARLMIYYPEGDVITSTIPPELNAAAVESFGHIKGFATATPGKVSRFQRTGKQCYLSGNIVADSIPCTDNERQRIIAAFNTGVYLPSL